MSTWRSRVLSSLVLVLLVSVAAAAQVQAPLVRVVGVPGGGTELLLTRVDAERGLLFLNGSVPGHNNAIVRVRASVKAEQGS